MSGVESEGGLLPILLCRTSIRTLVTWTSRGVGEAAAPQRALRSQDGSRAIIGTRAGRVPTGRRGVVVGSFQLLLRQPTV